MLNAPPKAVAANQPTVVLLVENDPGHRDLVQRAFARDSGSFQLVIADTVQSARRRLAETHCDIVLADYRLPDGNGAALLEGAGAPPVIIMTSFGDERLAAAVIKSGASDYVAKGSSAVAELPELCRRTLTEIQVRQAQDAARMEQAKLLAAENRDRRFRELFHNVPVGIYQALADGTLVAGNRALHCIIGTDANLEAPALGKVTDFFRGANWTETVQCLKRDGFLRGVECQIETRAGERRDVLANVDAVKDESGQLRGYEGSLTDITAKKRAERAVRESEERCRTLVENAPEAILVVDADSGNFVDANENACQMFGASRIDLMRGGPTSFSPELQSDGTPSTEAARLYIDQALAGAKPVFEWQHADIRGHTVPCEVRLVRLPNSGRRLVRASVVDISARKAAERALRESELRFQGIFNQTAGYVVIMSPEGIVLDINNTALAATGTRRELVLGRPLWEMQWWVKLHAEVERIRAGLAAARQGYSQRDECDFLGTRGDVRRMDRSITPITNADGDIVMIIAEGHDVTDRLRAEQKNQRYAQRLQSLSQRLMVAQETERAHIARELHDEIGQDLTAIKLSLAAAIRASEPGQRTDLLLESATTVGRLLEQIRNLSLDLRPAMLDDLGLAAALRWLMSRQTQRAGLKLQLKIAQNLPRLRAPVESACYRICQEAMTNIVRHASATTVTLEVTMSANQLMLCLTDDGVGFDVGHRQRLAQSGDSFGLVGMLERAALAGGDLRIHSEPGAGTQVTATFSNAGGKS